MVRKKNKIKKIVKREEPKSTYEAKDIYVLEGLEPVRRRPGMYIGSTGPDGLHHLIYECCDNALDEFMAGFGNEMMVILLTNNRVNVTDNGRGIPVEKHPQTKKSALETVMTTLHAGAKFGGKSYTIAGGLHGVGVSVVCALSSWTRVEVARQGKLWAQEYSRGKVTTSVKLVGKSPKGITGTSVTFEPDSQIFKEIKFDWKKILNHLRQQAYLTKGIRIKIVDEREEEKQKEKQKEYSFYFDGGIISYVKYLTKEQHPIHSKIFYYQKEAKDILVEITFRYTKDIESEEVGFANNIYTGEGGMHLTGFRSAFTRGLNDYARRNNFLKEKEENFSGEDVREGLTAIVSVKLKEPQFEGQTKARLGNPEARTAVEIALSEGLEEWLEKNPQDAREIIGKCSASMKARKAAKTAKEAVLRKGLLEGLALPGKLADCISRKPEESELFIVEGDSAGGSARQGRDRHFQAILPLRGKILNVERASLSKILASKEIKALIIALGSAISQDFDINKLRYHRIILMSDADSDGNHIKTLLLTLFYRYFPQIIERGYLYIAQPPLYKIQSGKNIEYTYSEEEKEKILNKIKKEKGEEVLTKISIQRYKGLGEMNPSLLWETTMDPEKRILKKVTIEDVQEADRIFDILMGEEVSSRKRFIQTHAKEAQNIDI